MSHDCGVMKHISVTHKRFGEKIKGLRKKMGMTQEDLAFKIKVDRSYMGFIERGERNPSLNRLDKIAKSFKISLSELFKGI